MSQIPSSSLPPLSTLLDDENALWMSARLVVAAICIANAVIQWRHVHNQYSPDDLRQIYTAYNYLGGISVGIGFLLLMSGIKFGMIPLLIGAMAFAQELILIHLQPLHQQRIVAIVWTAMASILGLMVVYKAYTHHEERSQVVGP